MTIAIGMLTADGAILCSDTQYTTSAKVQKKKIFATKYGKGLMVTFVLAGHEGYGTMAIQRCKLEIAKCVQKSYSVEDLLGCVEKVISKINRDHVNIQPPEDRENCRFELLMLVWHEIAGLHLYAIRKTAIVETDSYECLGTGEYLAGYLMSPYQRTMSAKRATTLTLTTLASIMEYDAWSGGHAHLMVFRSDGSLVSSDIFPPDVEDTHIGEYRSRVRSMLFRIADAELSDEIFERELAEFTASIRRIRESWRESHKKWRVASAIGYALAYAEREWDKHLEEITARASGVPSPQSTTNDPSPLPPSPESPGGSGES